MTPRHAAMAARVDDAIRRYEHRRVCVEGWFWPVERQNMRHPLTIRARMIEDLQLLFLKKIYPDAEALAARGWTLAQLADHGERAIDTFFHREP